MTSNFSFSQENASTSSSTQKPELKLSSEPVEKKDGKQPELKLVDPVTINSTKPRQRPKGKPELKLVSK